jgi:hypothetical protein
MQKAHRVIYELHILLWNNQHVLVRLDRSGNAIGDANDGRPHPPKLRTVDLRAGDKVMFGASWYLIRGIVCTRDRWLTEDEAAKLGGDEGFVYRPPPYLLSRFLQTAAARSASTQEDGSGT